MIDKFDFLIPFLPSAVDALVIDDPLKFAETGYLGATGFVDVQKLGLDRLGARDAELSDDGSYPVVAYFHRWESIPSSFTPVAFKIFEGEGGNIFPHVRVKASPAKLLQGHNVFGPDDPFLCGSELLSVFATSQPELFSKLDVKRTVIMNIDCTYSAQVRTVEAMKNALEYLRNVQNKQMKPSGIIESTVYFNRGSEMGSFKAYIKSIEFLNQLKELKRNNKTGVYDNAIKVMSDLRLQSYVQMLLRFEATLTRRKLIDLGLCPSFVGFCKAYEQYRLNGRNLISELFSIKMSPLREALAGITMNIFDDEKVKNMLFSAYTKFDKKGRLNDSLPRSLLTTFRNISRDGYETTKQSMAKPTFHRHIKLITEAGISKAQLQNAFRERMHNNVVPLLQVIEIDFSSQFPDWYVEPVSQFADGNVTSLNNRRISHSLKMAI